MRSTVSNEDLGRLRMHFFRDSLSSIISTSNTNLRSPVLEVLAEAQSSTPWIDLQCLHTMIDARERDLSYPNFASLADLAAFTADLQSPPIRAHASVLLPTGKNPEQEDGCQDPHAELAAASRFAGEAVGLTILLRGAPTHAANRLSYAPADIIRDRGVEAQAAMSSGPAAASVYSAVAARAERALHLAEDAVSVLPLAVRPAFWCLELPRIYLPRLSKAGGDPFDEKLQQGMLQTYPLRLQLALVKQRLLSRLRGE